MKEVIINEKGSGRFIIFYEDETGYVRRRFQTKKEAIYFHDNLKTEDKYYYKDRSWKKRGTITGIKIIAIFIIAFILYYILGNIHTSLLPDAVDGY